MARAGARVHAARPAPRTRADATEMSRETGEFAARDAERRAARPRRFRRARDAPRRAARPRRFRRAGCPATRRETATVPPRWMPRHERAGPTVSCHFPCLNERRGTFPSQSDGSVPPAAANRTKWHETVVFAPAGGPSGPGRRSAPTSAPPGRLELEPLGTGDALVRDAPRLSARTGGSAVAPLSEPPRHGGASPPGVAVPPVPGYPTLNARRARTRRRPSCGSSRSRRR
jgi:hypothetical protein